MVAFGLQGDQEKLEAAAETYRDLLSSVSAALTHQSFSQLNELTELNLLSCIGQE